MENVIKCTLVCLLNCFMVLIKIALVNEVSMLKIILENIFTFQKWTSHDIT